MGRACAPGSRLAARSDSHGRFHAGFHAGYHARPGRVTVADDRHDTATEKRHETQTAAATTSQNRQSAGQADLKALKARQQAAWSSGDYAVIGTTLQIVGEELCEALDVRSGQKVLDVAAGNGNVSLAAARRWCDVVATDYVPALLERARERAAAERLDIEFREADAEALPFPDEQLRRRSSRPSA